MAGHPAKLQARFAEIVSIIDHFCDEHLDVEFRHICRSILAALVEAGVPLESGKAAGWAAGIVYSVGYVNFLIDPSEPYQMAAEDMAKAAGVSLATLMNRARVIRETFDIQRMDPRRCTKRTTKHNPLVWMVMVNGVPHDIRMAPREVQEAAVRRGLSHSCLTRRERRNHTRFACRFLFLHGLPMMPIRIIRGVGAAGGGIRGLLAVPWRAENRRRGHHAKPCISAPARR